MQTILGASGQIGHELAVHLKRDFTDDIRLVSRNPRKVDDSDQLHGAGLLEAMDEKRVTAMICRAPEFYGPGKTQSITNSAIIEPLVQGKAARVFLRDDTLRSLIYTPDASRAMALLGNTPDAYGQTWHLPCDDERLTYRAFIELAAAEFGTAPRYRVLKRWQLRLAGLFSRRIRDAAELLPRYEADNIFVSSKFETRFPGFGVTTFREGLASIRDEHRRAH